MCFIYAFDSNQKLGQLLLRQIDFTEGTLAQNFSYPVKFDRGGWTLPLALK
jgi:hypothetical protein